MESLRSRTLSAPKLCQNLRNVRGVNVRVQTIRFVCRQYASCTVNTLCVQTIRFVYRQYASCTDNMLCVQTIRKRLNDRGLSARRPVIAAPASANSLSRAHFRWNQRQWSTVRFTVESVFDSQVPTAGHAFGVVKMRALSTAIFLNVTR